MRFIAWLSAHALDWAEAEQVPARNEARANLHTASIWPYLCPFAAQVRNIAYRPNLLVHSQLCAENLSTTVISAMQVMKLGTATPSAAVGAISAQVDQLVAGS